jgi:hypothetical protein
VHPLLIATEVRMVQPRHRVALSISVVDGMLAAAAEQYQVLSSSW